MVEEKVVFNHTIEAMFIRGLGAKLTPTSKNKLREVGVDLDKRLLPAYPFATWMKSLELAANDAFPSRPLPDAMFQMGELLIDGYRGTVMGTAVLAMIRVLGPKKTLKRTAQNFRSGNNYTEATLTELTPTCFELWMNEVGPFPSFTAGIMVAGLRAAGAEGIECTPHGHDGHSCTYRLSWCEPGLKK